MDCSILNLEKIINRDKILAMKYDDNEKQNLKLLLFQLQNKIIRIQIVVKNNPELEKLRSKTFNILNFLDLSLNILLYWYCNNIFQSCIYFIK